MEWGITFFNELEKMKKRMGQVWAELFEETPEKEERIRGEFERFPKFEGIRRGASRSQQNRRIK